jgi:uncharacterized protein YdeI (YjbR/CyaY-like superfamily)
VSDGRPEDSGRPDALTVPHDLQTRLEEDAEAAAAFAALPPSHRREYVDWIVSAKRPDTRVRRVAETVRRVRQPRV